MIEVKHATTTSELPENGKIGATEWDEAHEIIGLEEELNLKMGKSGGIFEGRVDFDGGDFYISDGRMVIGTGYNQPLYGFELPGAPALPEGQKLHITNGTLNEPDSSFFGPLIQFGRTIGHKDTDEEAESFNNSVGGDRISTVNIFSTAAPGCTYTSLGLTIGSYNNNIDTPDGAGNVQSRPDSQGLLIVSVVGPDSSGLANCVTYNGRRYGPNGTIILNEFHIGNWTNTQSDHKERKVNNAAIKDGYPKTTGIWVVADGFADSSEFALFGNHYGRQLQNAFVFNDQHHPDRPTQIGGIRESIIYDYSHCRLPFRIAGQHERVLDTREAVLSTNKAITLGSTHEFGYDDASIARDSAGKLKVTNGGGSLAQIEASNLKGFNSGDQLTGPIHIAPTGGVAYIDVANANSGPVSMATVSDRFDLVPFIPSHTFIIDNVAINVTAGAASAQAKVVIYNSLGSLLPDAMVAESLNMDLSAVGLKSSALGFTFEKNKLYWVGSRVSGTATVGTLTPTALRPMFRFTATQTQIVGIRRVLSYATSSPASFGAVSLAEWVSFNTPMVMLRVA